MPPQYPTLDEQEFEDPDALKNIGFGLTLNSDNVLWYFMNSPFFDQASNNQYFLQLANTLPERDTLFYNRRAFEKGLEERYPTGVQFVVTHEAADPNQPWVIQRQLRSKGPNGETVMEVQGTFYTVGVKWFMAPSLLDVLQSRMLSVSNLMQDFFERGKNLTHWSPATGHTYLPSTYESSKPTMPGSRAGSVAPDSIETSQLSSTATTQTTTTTQPPETQTTQFSDDFFLHSLNLTTRYGHEYMDENPLQGEPGSFVFASTNQQVEARIKAQAAAQATGAGLVLPTKAVEGESAVSSVAPTPKPLPVAGIGVGVESRKGSIAGLPPKGKEKRRKSKGLASPISPNAPSAL